LGIRHLHVTEPTILADAVVGVDDVVVRLEFGEAREPVGGPGGQAAANLTALSEELRLGDEGEPIGGAPGAPRGVARQRRRRPAAASACGKRAPLAVSVIPWPASNPCRRSRCGTLVATRTRRAPSRCHPVRRVTTGASAPSAAGPVRRPRPSVE